MRFACALIVMVQWCCVRRFTVCHGRNPKLVLSRQKGVCFSEDVLVNLLKTVNDWWMKDHSWNHNPSAL